jgi:hypothetical protein
LVGKAEHLWGRGSELPERQSADALDARTPGRDNRYPAAGGDGVQELLVLGLLADDVGRLVGPDLARDQVVRAGAVRARPEDDGLPAQVLAVEPASLRERMIGREGDE